MQEGGIDTTTVVEKSGSENAEDHSGNRSLFEDKAGIDHFKNEENDPKATNALSKSRFQDQLSCKHMKIILVKE